MYFFARLRKFVLNFIGTGLFCFPLSQDRKVLFAPLFDLPRQIALIAVQRINCFSRPFRVLKLAGDLVITVDVFCHPVTDAPAFRLAGFRCRGTA